MPGMPTDGEIRAVGVYNVPGAGQNDEYVVVTNEPPRFSPNQQSVLQYCILTHVRAHQTLIL
jgi:hypothetical protein